MVSNEEREAIEKAGAKDAYTKYWNALNYHRERLEKEFIPLLMEAKSVVDIGCNCGELLVWMRLHNSSCALTGIEFNPKAAEIARRITAPFNIEIIETDATKYKGYAKFDLVYTWNPVHNPILFYPPIMKELAKGTRWFELSSYVLDNEYMWKKAGVKKPYDTLYETPCARCFVKL